MRQGVKLAKSKYRYLRITDEDAPLIAGLRAPHQEILTMAGSYQAKAALLGVAIGTIKSRTNRARASLVAAREAVLAGRCT